MKIVAITACIVLAATAVFLLRTSASRDARLGGVWQDRRLETMRKAAHDRGAVKGQGSWLVLEPNGEGRQIDYNVITLRTESTFTWRSEQKDGQLFLYRSFEGAGAKRGDTGRSGEVRYRCEVSPDGKTLAMTGEYGAASEYDRLSALPSQARQSSPNP